MKKIKIVLIIVVILIAMIITFATIDFKRVTSGEKPITATSNWVNALEPNFQVAMNTIDSNGTQNVDRKLNRSPENVTIEVLEDSITNTSVKILITDNNKDTYCYEEFFAVEEKINGEWKRLDYISDDIGWIEILYSLKNNNQLDQVLDIEEYYGKLDEGIYRIVKVIKDNENIEIYSNEFEIK